MRYHVCGLTIDTTRFRIERAGGEAVAVEPKVFDLLLYLIRHRERVVGREELFQTVWEGREVSDATLSNHVMSARRVLGDNGDLQGSIQTVRGRGYRLVAPVTEMPVVAAIAATPSARGWRPRWQAIAVLVALLVPASLVVAKLMKTELPVPSALAMDNRPYVVVVPFDAPADAPDHVRQFATQLTRDVIQKLEGISGLRVLSRRSTTGAFSTNKSREYIIERVPDVQYVLDGDVIAAPDGGLRFMPALEELPSGRLLFNKHYPFIVDGNSFFEMSSGIAEAVSTALEVEILKEEQRALTEFPTSNPRAYAPYVAGWEQMELFTPESLRRAIELFNEAIALDDQFFAAYMARSDTLRSLFGYFEPPIKMMAAVESSLNEALAIRNGSAEALASLGLTQVMAWRWQEAWDSLSQARARSRAFGPDLALAELGFALYYTALGDVEKVRRSIEAANRIDPLNIEMADWGTWTLFMSREYEVARRWGEEKMRQHPDNGLIACGAGIAAYLADDTAGGVRLLEQCVRKSARAPVALIMLAQGYGYDNQVDRVEPLLREADSAGIYTCPYESAVAWLSIGAKERAIPLLFDAVEKRSNCLIFLHVDPRLDPIRDDPRYAELLVKVGLDANSRARYHR